MLLGGLWMQPVRLICRERARHWSGTHGSSETRGIVRISSGASYTQSSRPSARHGGSQSSGGVRRHRQVGEEGRERRRTSDRQRARRAVARTQASRRDGFVGFLVAALVLAVLAEHSTKGAGTDRVGMARD